jgi:hypothetical protein
LWIPALAFFLRAHLEAAESTKINFLALSESVGDDGKRGMDHMLCFCFAALRSRGNLVDEVVPVHQSRR